MLSISPLLAIASVCYLPSDFSILPIGTKKNGLIITSALPAFVLLNTHLLEHGPIPILSRTYFKNTLRMVFLNFLLGWACRSWRRSFPCGYCPALERCAGRGGRLCPRPDPFALCFRKTSIITRLPFGHLWGFAGGNNCIRELHYSAWRYCAYQLM